MIESSILCSSTWDTDLFQDFAPDLEKSFVLETNEYVGDLDNIIETTPLFCTSINDDISSCSSDYEQLSLDGFSDMLPISDNFVSHILADNDAIGLSDFDWESIGESPSSYNSISPCSSNRNLNQNNVKENTVKRKRKRSTEFLHSSKLWSKMTSEEQLQTLHTLSEIVTCHMDIRAQIEVIKIINPSAVITPDDKEFALDISFLNDTKLKRLKEFVKKHHSALENSSSCSKDAKKVSSYSKLKRKQKKPKIPYVDEWKRIERKVKRQGKKEVRSGLFVYEKKIKLLSQPAEENEDVNILE